MSFPVKKKDPQAVLDYAWDWTAWLNAGETISNATVTAPAGITKDSQSSTGTTVTAWLSGGSAGTNYDVVCHITTSASRQDDRTITIQCENR